MREPKLAMLVVAVSTLAAAPAAMAASLSLTPIDPGDAQQGQRAADFSATYINFFSSHGANSSPPLANGCVAESDTTGPVLQYQGVNRTIENSNVINVRRAPLGDGTCFLTTVGANSFVMDLTQFRNGGDIAAFGFLWGSIDEYNSLELLDISAQPLNIVGFGPSFFTGAELATFTGLTLYSNRYVNFRFGPNEDFRYAVFRTTNTAFEIDNVRVNNTGVGTIVVDSRPLAVAEPAALALGAMGFVAALSAARARASRGRRPAAALGFTA